MRKIYMWRFWRDYLRGPGGIWSDRSPARRNSSSLRGCYDTLEERRLLSVSTGGLLGDEFDEVRVAGYLYGIQHVTPVGDRHYFMASDGVHDQSLWVTDGTAEGTVALAYDVGDVAYAFTPVGDQLYFMSGATLWVSGGTRETTRALAKLSDTFVVGLSFPPTPGSPASLAKFGGSLLFSPSPHAFSSFSGEFGAELWATNGRSEGTRLVKDIRPGPESSNIQFLGSTQEWLYLLADDGVHGAELWVTNGTAVGTKLVKDVRPGEAGLEIRASAVFDGRLYFVARNGWGNFELWSSDGTATGTQLIRGFQSGSDERRSSDFTVVGDQLFFLADDGAHGREIWRTDGTTDGTWLVKDMVPGSSSSGFSVPHSLVAVGDELYFESVDATDKPEIWKTDGTFDGTLRVWSTADEPALGDAGVTVGLNRGTSDGVLYFSVGSDSFPKQLRKTDGTSGFSELVAEIAANGVYSVASGQLLIVGRSNDQPIESFWETTTLWTSDGRPQSLQILQPSIPQHLVAGETLLVGDRLYFAGFTTEHGSELWWTEGYKHEIHRVTDIRPGRLNSRPGQLTEAGGSLYFVAETEPLENRLWRTDPWSGHVEQLTDFRPFELTALDGGLYFTNGRRELWRSDANGTALLFELPGTNRDRVLSLTVVGNSLLYVLELEDETFNRSYELWSTDGTLAGSLRLTQQLDSWAIGEERAFDKTLYFAKADGSLWKTDGTLPGTVLVRGGFVGGSLGRFADVNGTLFFSADDGIHGRELWKSDGTAAGTMLVKDIYAGEGMSTPAYLTNVNGTLFFVAYDPNTGSELWKSDGTAEGTILVSDIRPGGVGAAPNGLLAVEGMLYFTAVDGVQGRELWRSDGTVAGTILIRDAHEGSSGSYPGNLTAKDGYLFFTADNGVNGREMWRTAGTEATTVRLVYAELNQADGIAVFDRVSSDFFVKYQAGGGLADEAFQFGVAAPQMIPLMGDWDGDGLRTPGLFDSASSMFYLKDTLGPGGADHVFDFGAAGIGWQPLVGDWDGDGRETVGLYSGQAFYLRNQLSGGFADAYVEYGSAHAGWTAVAGDWNGDGVTTVGLYLDGVFFLKDDLLSGPADVAFQFGTPGGTKIPLVGDWNGSGRDSIGLYAQGSTFLRYENAPGIADKMFSYGPGEPGWVPLVGPWTKRLDEQQIASIVDAVLERLESLGVDSSMLAYLAQVKFVVANLAPFHTSPSNTTLVDPAASGRGWFVDPTPWSDEEFVADLLRPGKLQALDASAADNRVDLFSAVLHTFADEAQYFGHAARGPVAKFREFEPGVREQILPEWVAESFPTGD